MQGNALAVNDLTKKYRDFVLDHVSFSVPSGTIVGLIGENGAGKSTTIGMLSTLFLPTEGEIRIDGERLTRQNTALKRKISVVTQEYSMRQDMTIEEIMEYQGRLYFVPKKQRRKKIQELLEFCGLMDYRRRTVRKLSGGMKRKLMVCRALLTEPEILLLDEPTAGMDALARRQMWNLLKRLNRNRLTILLTTHYMEEAEFLCDRIVMIYQGQVIAKGTPEELRAQTHTTNLRDTFLKLIENEAQGGLLA